MKTMLFNPYTGTPRHPSDIASDPEGILLLDPDEPVKAAPTAVEPDEPLKWCSYCGEGVTSFCRGKQSPDWDYKCPVLNLLAGTKGTP